MKESWRWYGPNDPVSLSDIRQAGATDVVHALHHLPNGAIWTEDEIAARRKLIAEAGLTWSVVESLPVHESIKTAGPDRDQLIEHYIKSLEALSAQDIRIVCYNFMPVLDWTRTDLQYVMPDGSQALRFDRIDLAIFDILILRRKNAEENWTKDEVKAASERFRLMSALQHQKLAKTILAGLPGAEEGYHLDSFRAALATYDGIDHQQLRANLAYFLDAICPHAERLGINMVIHPDDPPFDILGLPRILCRQQDVQWLFDNVPSPANGLTFCTGSFGVNATNDLPAMVRQFADRIHFVHLRSTKRDAIGNFVEADHLDGDVDMFAVIEALITEEKRRKESDQPDWEIPMRPDHGHQMLDDLEKTTNPGYSAIGRLRGLAELRGLMHGIKRTLQ